MGPNPDVIRAMTEQMAALFVGDTPLAPQRLINRVLGAGWYPFHRTAGLVLGGLEMACWDAVGKHLGQPVSTFFGGALKTSFPSMYYIQAQSDLDAMVEQARDAVGRGFGTIYFKVAIEEERDVELVRRVREAVGRRPQDPRRRERGVEPRHRRPHPAPDGPVRDRVHRAARLDVRPRRHGPCARRQWRRRRRESDLVGRAPDPRDREAQRGRRDHDRPASGGRPAADEEDPRPVRDGRAAVREPRVQRDHDHARGPHAGDVHVELDDPRDPGSPRFPRRRLRDAAARLHGRHARGVRASPGSGSRSTATSLPATRRSSRTRGWRRSIRRRRTHPSFPSRRFDALRTAPPWPR